MISLWVYRYQPISHSSCSSWAAIYGSYDLIVWENKNVTSSFFVRYGKIQHMSNNQGVRLKAHTLIIVRVLYFPISHSNEHRLHIVIIYYSFVAVNDDLIYCIIWFVIIVHCMLPGQWLCICATLTSILLSFARCLKLELEFGNWFGWANFLIVRPSI